MAYADDVERGCNTFGVWLAERFPRASVLYTGTERNDFHRWTVDFGYEKAGFRVGATERVLSDEGILSRRIRDLDTHGWLEDVEEKSKWVVLNAVGVAAKSRDDW